MLFMYWHHYIVYNDFDFDLILMKGKNELYIMQNLNSRGEDKREFTCRAFSSLEASIQWYFRSDSYPKQNEPILNNRTNEVRLVDEVNFVVKSKLLLTETRMGRLYCVANNSQGSWFKEINISKFQLNSYCFHYRYCSFSFVFVLDFPDHGMALTTWVQYNDTDNDFAIVGDLVKLHCHYARRLAEPGFSGLLAWLHFNESSKSKRIFFCQFA